MDSRGSHLVPRLFCLARGAQNYSPLWLFALFLLAPRCLLCVGTRCITPWPRLLPECVGSPQWSCLGVRRCVPIRDPLCGPKSCPHVDPLSRLFRVVFPALSFWPQPGSGSLRWTKASGGVTRSQIADCSPPKNSLVWPSQCPPCGFSRFQRPFQRTLLPPALGKTLANSVPREPGLSPLGLIPCITPSAFPLKWIMPSIRKGNNGTPAGSPWFPSLPHWPPNEPGVI